MARLSVLSIATEAELETEKLLEMEDAAAKGSTAFSDLYKKVWTQENEKKAQQEKPVSGDGGGGGYSSDSSSDDSSDDSGDDSGDDDGMGDMDFDMEDEGDGAEGDEEPEDEDEPEDEEPEESEATESAFLFAIPSLENLESEFNLIHASMALENDGYGEESTASKVGRSIWEAAKVVGSAMYVAGTALGWVGINILWPGMKKLYKVVIYLGAKFVRYGILSAKKVNETQKRFSTRTSKLREDIESASVIAKTLAQRFADKSAIEAVKVTSTYENVKIINRIKIGDTVNPNETSAVMHEFLKGWYTKISRDISKDTEAIKHVLHYGVEASINPVKTFGDSSMRKGLVPDDRVTHELKNGFVDALRYQQVFPGDMVYCAALPNGKSQTLDEVREAYAASTCSFNLEARSFKKIEQVDYMKLEDLVKLLTNLNGMVDTLEEQEALYKQINEEKSSYLLKFKKYFLSLADYDKKISVEQSMLEYIYLRSVFIDNVYTVTARDIHMFTQQYIANVLTYVKSNLDKLSS